MSKLKIKNRKLSKEATERFLKRKTEKEAKWEEQVSEVLIELNLNMKGCK